MSEFIFYALSVMDIEKNLSQTGHHSLTIILPHAQLTPHLALENDQFEKLAIFAWARGLRVAVDLDLIPDDDQLEKIMRVVAEILTKWPKTIFRVKNYGLASLLVSYYPNILLHLNVEFGHHNKESLLKLAHIFEKNLQRFILSIELPQNDIAAIVAALPSSLEIEILLHGPIFLFYSPRKLLGRDEKNEARWPSSHLFALADSEENAHKNFRVYQNSHGTILYHHKYLSLLEEWEKLAQLGVTHFRLDWREIKDRSALYDSWQKKEYLQVATHTPFKTIRGFHQNNKSDSIFVKLKNQNLRRQGPQENGRTYLGTVMDVQRGGHLAILNLNSTNQLCVGEQIVITTPEGKEITVKVASLFNSRWQSIERLAYEEIGFINYVKGVTTKSKVEKV